MFKTDVDDVDEEASESLRDCLEMTVVGVGPSAVGTTRWSHAALPARLPSDTQGQLGKFTN